jgi:hypothetical protein
MSDTMRLLLPDDLPLGDYFKNLVPVALLPHPQTWRELYSDWEELLVKLAVRQLETGGPASRAALHQSDEIDEEFLDMQERCMRRGCNKVMGLVALG